MSLSGAGPAAGAQVNPLLVALADGAFIHPDDSSTTTTTLPGGPTTTTSTTTTLPGQTTTTVPSATTSTIAPTTTTTLSAQQVLANALVAVQGERGVRWTSVEAAGNESVTAKVHAGLVDGTLTDTLHLAKSGSVSYSLHGRVYFHGTANGLAEDLGFKAKYAAAEANKWISASATSSTFIELAGIMTMADVSGQVDLQGAKVAVEAETSTRGVPTIPVVETLTASGVKITQTVYIKAKGEALPVEIIREIDGVEGVITFKDWGQPPDATVPKHSTQFSSSWVTAS